MARRGKGEGTIRKRADRPGWEGVLTLANGQRKSVYGRSRQEVQRKLAEVRRSVEQGLPIAGERQTVKAYLSSWLEDMRPPKVREHTWTRYDQQVRLHIVPTLGSVPLGRLSAQQVQRLIAAKQQAGLSASSVKLCHGVLSHALRAAVELGLLPRNVAALVHVSKAKRPEVRTLDEREANRLLEGAAGERLAALYTLALTTGMRQAELLGLRWRDVDLEHGLIMVQVQLSHTAAGGFTLTRPKTAKGVRRIALGAEAVDALRAHRKRQLEERLAHADVWDDTLGDLVFTNEIGQPIRGSHLLEAEFKPLLRRLGLPAIRFHDLRHTAATLLLRRGEGEKVVQEMLGHSDIGITLGVYAHVTPDMQRHAAETMDRIFRKGRDEDQDRDRGS